MYRMFACALLFAVTVAPLCLSTTSALASPAVDCTSLDSAVSTGYIVWYRYDNGRWHGRGPYSTYYHASIVLNDYLQSGAQAYIQNPN